MRDKVGNEVFARVTGAGAGDGWWPATLLQRDPYDDHLPCLVLFHHNGVEQWLPSQNIVFVAAPGPQTETPKPATADIPEWLATVLAGNPAASPLPEDSDLRKQFALFRCLLQYFPAALTAVAYHSYISNEKHNPGEEPHHARGKSGDHADCVMRHLMDDEWVNLCWRALAGLQEKAEAAGAPVAPAARFPKE